MADLNDAAFKVQRARVWKLVTRWKQTLGLEQWHISHEFFRGSLPGERGPTDAWGGVLARGFPDHRYLQASIQWSMEACGGTSDDDLQKLVIHELAHCLTDPFKRYAMHETPEGTLMGPDEMERQVTEIQHALSFAYDAGLRDGKMQAKGKAP